MARTPDLPSLLLAAALALLSGCPDDKKGCPAGQSDCGGLCTDVQTDARNCGACGLRCALGGVCSAGQCGCPAAAPDLCGSTCVNLQADAAHCGQCEHACGTGTCVGGTCDCTGTLNCGPSVSPQCVNGQTDAANCGVCGQSCGPGTCASGACACTGFTACPAGSNPACRDTRADRLNCGSCGNACADGAICQAPGNCFTCAGTAPNRCGNACASLQTDAANCGTCGNACSGGKVCVAGACACPAGQTDCSGTCRDLAADEAHCGSCTQTCATGQTCVGGACCSTVVCGATCCDGGSACCAGSTCPPAHDNGAGGSYFDCNPLGSYSEAAALAAALSWAQSGARVTVGLVCPNDCIAWQVTVNQITSTGVWCHAGATQGRARVVQSAVPVCPGAGDSPWN